LAIEPTLADDHGIGYGIVEYGLLFRTTNKIAEIWLSMLHTKGMHCSSWILFQTGIFKIKLFILRPGP
jgi:hypothetical protein